MEKSRTFKLNFNSMRNKILLLLTALLGMNNQMWAGNVEIPDADFKSLLVADYDTNKDGEISTKEAEAVTGTINVSYAYKKKCHITSVKGIEAFKNINGFKCEGNSISGVLDLRGNPKITVLKCSSNAGITKIMLAKNSSSLTTIESYEIASLTDLDLSGAPNLSTLDCHGCTHLTSLNVTKNPSLKHILCYNCSIDMINLLYNTLYYTNAQPKLWVGNQKDINGSDKCLTILGSSSKYNYYMENLATNENNGNVEFKSISGTAVRYKKAGESNWSYEEVTKATSINDGQFDNYEVMWYKTAGSYTLNYTRTFKTGIWAAWMLPFKVVLRKERMEGLKFAKVVSSSKSGGTLKVVVEPLALNDALEANTPYVVLNTTSTDIERTFSVTLQPLVINTNLSPTVVGDCTFESNYGIITSQDGDDWYALAADESGFTHITQSGLSLKPFRFLLRVNGGSSQAKIAIAESNATGIQSLKNARESDAYYDLMGRRVQHPTKGIYIHQGKKIIIK